MFLVRLLLLLTTLLMISCSDGEIKESSQSSPFAVSNRTIVDYSAVSVTVNFQGAFESGSVNDLDEVQFYSQENCQGSPIGSILMQTFKTDGINLDLTPNVETSLYISTLASSECFFVEDYTNPVLAPQDPSFVNVSPPSPSRTVFTPGLFGNGFPDSGTVSFYDDAGCLNLLDQGSVSDFKSSGVQVTVPQNATTSIHAQISDFANTTSACVPMLDYVHSDALSDPPLLTSLTPASPSNSSTTPTVVGTTAVGTVTVGLYSDSACSILLADGDPADFSSTGFQISMGLNSTITIYAKSMDNMAQPSVCALLGSYTHDDVPPDNPSYSSANPVSPTNQTTSPSIIGTSSIDTDTMRFYDSNFCLTSLGVGTKAEFEGSGIAVGVGANDTTQIYGRAFDEAGNESDCVSFTSYSHNTIPPNSPLFSATVPTSPTNQSTTPFIQGDAASRTVQLNFYDDAGCLSLIGQGSATDYENAGIQLTVGADTTTSIYTTVSDLEGNVSSCEFHASYDHSSAASPDPAFFATFPASPSNSSNTPSVIGTADSSIQSVNLYSENTCTNSLGGGSRGQFVSSGVTVNLPLNSTNDIYAQATDIYGNLSSCSLLTQYIHNTIPPLDPTYTAVSPVSPNNMSITPTITGDSLHNPSSQLQPLEVSFYDSPSCVSRLGQGTPADYNTPGLVINVAANGLTQIYGRTEDAAGNVSNCTYLTDYIHNNRVPAAPQFLSASPGSPSYNPDISITGAYGTSSDFMNRVSIIVYDDPGCTNELTNADPALFDSTGVPVTVGLNQITDLYALTVNEVGTQSACTSLTSFRHHDLPPSSVNAVVNSDGSINLTWFPDTIASPAPSYSIERSLSSTGPFTVINANQASNSFRDYFVSDNTEYFYRVYASNSTGRSQNSSVVSETVVSPPSVPAASLTATGYDATVTLTWSGFPQNMAYKLSRSLNYGGPFERIGTDILTTSYQDDAVVNNQTYYYLIEATNPSGLSMRSNIASVVPRPQPAAPLDLKVTPMESNSACGGARGVRLSWTGSSYFTNYRVYRSQYKNTNNVVASPSTHYYDQCGLNSAGRHYFSIASQWGTFASTESNTIGFYSSNAPSLTISPGDSEVVLTWSTPSLGTELSGFTIHYNVYKASDIDDDFSIVAADITGNIFTDSSVINGDGAFYYVQGYITDGGGDRVYVGYPTSVESGSADLAPTNPTNLTATYIESGDRLQLDWTRPTHYNGFQVYHATSLGGPYSPLYYVSNSFVLGAALSQGMNYFKVTSVWGSTESADSNIVSFREGKIGDLLASPTATDIALSWTAIPTATDYVVYRAQDINGPYSSIGIAPSNSYTDLTPVANNGYYYRVKSRFADLTESVLSNTIAATRTDSTAPVNLSLSVQNASFIKVNWPAVSGASQYEVFLATSFGGPYQSRGLTVSTEFNLLGLAANTEYFVKVASIVGMVSTESSVVSAFTYGFPTTPTGVVGDNQIEISWSALSGVTNYDILRSSDGISFSTLATAYPSTNYVDLTALNGNIYFYKIQGNFASGQTLSPSSQGFSPGAVPLTPTNLVAENNDTGTEINLSWSRVSGQTSYNVYSSTSSGSYGAPVRSATTNKDVRVTGLTSGTVYYFVVTAVNGSQESPVSNEIVVVPQLEPAKPIAQYNNPTSIDITWSVDPLASTYSLYRSDDGVVFLELANNLATSSYNDIVPNVNRTYYYKYKGFTAAGVELSFSKVSDGTNLSVVPAVPIGLQAFTANTSEVNLEWTFVPNLQRYEIYRGTSTGGPYSLLASPGPGDITYTDSTVVPGSSYYYVIRSVNLSGVPSIDSLEVSVDLIAGPTNLALVNGASTIDVSWDSLGGGVVSYNLRRSLESGGPYGLITNTASLTYSDTDFVADKTYYYIVEGVYADGRVTVQSSEQSITRAGYLFLQVPVELTDTPVSSASASSLAFERTRTSFNTDYYDGVSSYEFEVVATNLDSVNRSIHIINEANSSVGFVSIPALTNNPTRFKAVVTPTVGSEVYRLETEQTGSDGDLSIFTAKLLVNQENATKTRIYIPLVSSDRFPSNLDDPEYVFSTSDETYQDYNYALLYQRDTAKFKEIIDYNAWELEAVVSTTGLAEGIFGLENINTSSIVNTTETRFDDNLIRLASVPFDEGVAGFDSNTEGDRYRLSFRCEYNCASGAVNLYKAGIWVTLENLSKARVVHRLGLNEEAVSSNTDLIDERIYFDVAKYSSPQIYYQALLEDDPTSSGSVELVYHNQDSGSAGLIVTPSSNLLVDSDTLSLYMSPVLSLTTLQNYVTRINTSSGSIDFRGSSVIIDIGN